MIPDVQLAAGEHDPPALVVVAGQSNALGFTLGLADLPPPLRVGDRQVMIWDAGRGTFVVMKPGRNTGTAKNPQAWGPEAQLGWRWRQAYPTRALYIVKYARGETGLAKASDQLDWAPTSADEAWARATAEIAAAKADLASRHGSVKVDAILWMQGETDAHDPSKARAYASHLADFITRSRAAWGDDSTRICIGQVHNPTPAADGWDMVRAAQAKFGGSDPRLGLVDTDRFARRPDGLHLSSKGQLALGDGFYACATRR